LKKLLKNSSLSGFPDDGEMIKFLKNCIYHHYDQKTERVDSNIHHSFNRESETIFFKYFKKWRYNMIIVLCSSSVEFFWLQYCKFNPPLLLEGFT
jgi:hypothetical protein